MHGIYSYKINSSWNQLLWDLLYNLQNQVYSWNQLFEQIVYAKAFKPHPNIFARIEFIQTEEAVTKAKIQRIPRNNQAP